MIMTGGQKQNKNTKKYYVPYHQICEAERSGRNDRSREGERARQWMFEGKVVAMTKTMRMMMMR